MARALYAARRLALTTDGDANTIELGGTFKRVSFMNNGAIAVIVYLNLTADDSEKAIYIGAGMPLDLQFTDGGVNTIRAKTTSSTANLDFLAL